MLFNDVVAAIGHTPTVRLRLEQAPGVEVYAKLELQNLFAMKDRVARHIIQAARSSGALAPGAPIVESSSGTMALGLALVGAHFGHPVHIVTDPRIDPITLAKLRALDCRVHIVERMTSGGWQSARLRRLHRLLTDLDGAFWLQQYDNPQNPNAYTSLAAELRSDVGAFDVLVGSVGSGGSLSGTARALHRDLPRLRTVAVDCVGSVLFGQPDQPQRRQSGLGNSLYPTNLDYGLIDEVHWLDDAEAFSATRELAREQGLFAGNTSGSVYRVLLHLARQARPGTRLVGIFPDRGDRYVESVYADAASTRIVPPVEVQYGTQVRRWSYARLGQADRRRFVFVESNTTGSGMAALWTAFRLGMEPVLLTSAPRRYAGLSTTPARVIECDTNDSAAVCAAVALEARTGRLAGVSTTSEFFVRTAAEAARASGVPAVSPVAAGICRNKAIMRTTLAAAEVGQPGFVQVDALDELPAAVTKVGLPCVVKPVDDTGSFNVLLCRSVREVQEHAQRVISLDTNVRGQRSAPGVLVETYLDAPEYSVEVIAHDGTYTCLGVVRKRLGEPPFFVETGHLYPAPEPQDIADVLSAAARRALGVCGFDHGVAHVELKMTSAGPSVIEINPRPAGGMIPELMRLAGGPDPVDLQIRTAAGMPLPGFAVPTRHAGIRFLTSKRDGTVARIEGLDAARAVAGVEQVVITTMPGSGVRRARSAYDRLGFVVAVGTSAAEVERSLGEAEKQITIKLTASEPHAHAGGSR